MFLVFEIDPVPASRPRVPRFGRVYYAKPYSEFKDDMSKLVLAAPASLFDCPLSTEITFFKLIPVSLSNKKRNDMDGKLCISNADLDNLEKAIYDALQGRVYVDDKQIVSHSTKKVWVKERPRIEILINELPYESAR